MDPRTLPGPMGRDLAAGNSRARKPGGLSPYGLRTTGITVHLDLAPDLPDVLADASQLHRVFTNLFVNAQQALLEVPEPRWLHIATRWERPARMLSVAITDNGPGVPEPIRWRIFDPFFTMKPMGVGTGVGLSLRENRIISHSPPHASHYGFTQCRGLHGAVG